MVYLPNMTRRIMLPKETAWKPYSQGSLLPWWGVSGAMKTTNHKKEYRFHWSCSHDGQRSWCPYSQASLEYCSLSSWDLGSFSYSVRYSWGDNLQRWLIIWWKWQENDALDGGKILSLCFYAVLILGAWVPWPSMHLALGTWQTKFKARK